MLFNSLEFLWFLPLVFFLYWRLKNRLRTQNLFLVSASYLFYGWWDVRFLLLIAFTSFCSYYSGILIEDNIKNAKKINMVNIVINLFILGVFKYFNFFEENLILLFKSFGLSLSPSYLHIILPVGISFYTFQALSYSIDVYHKKIAATRDVVAFFAYVSFFPQLVAGPIERSTNLLNQFYKKRVFSYPVAVDGMRQMLFGFFKKLVVADNCAQYETIAKTNENRIKFYLIRF